MKDGKPSWDMKADMNGSGNPDWLDVVEQFKRHGFEWGGNWKKRDNPHLQKIPDHITFAADHRKVKPWKILLEMHDQGKVDENGYIKLELPF